MNPSLLSSPEALLPSLRRLARSLVNGDPQLAEDLVQDAWLITLQREGRPHWRGLLRSLLFRRRRAEARRLRHEALAARDDRANDVVEETTLPRELTDHVLALDEPYRTTVLLRFLEELPPREIARRMDCPVATVSSRLTRGLSRLRDRIGSDPEARERWALGMVPFLGSRDDALIGLGVLMTAKTIAAIAAGVGLLAFAGWRMLGAPAPEVATQAAATLAPLVAADDAGTRPAPDSPGELAAPGEAPARMEVEESTTEAAPLRPSGLEEDPAPVAATATLSGTLLIPYAWKFTEFMLIAHAGEDGTWKRGELEQDPSASPSDFFEFPFEFENLPVGAVVVLLNPVQTFERITLPAEGLRDLVIEVPMPATATVQVINSLTGAPVPGGEVGWSMAMPSEIPEYSLNGVERQGEEPVTVQVAEGQANFFFHHIDYWSEETTHEMTAGENEIVLEVAPSTGVILTFFDAFGQPTRHPRIEWNAVSGPGSIIGMAAVQDASHKIRLTLSEPGTYRVALSANPLEGIEDPEPFELTVFEGEVLEHEIRLLTE